MSQSQAPAALKNLVLSAQDNAIEVTAYEVDRREEANYFVYELVTDDATVAAGATVKRLFQPSASVKTTVKISYYGPSKGAVAVTLREYTSTPTLSVAGSSVVAKAYTPNIGRINLDAPAADIIRGYTVSAGSTITLDKVWHGSPSCDGIPIELAEWVLEGGKTYEILIEASASNTTTVRPELRLEWWED